MTVVGRAYQYLIPFTLIRESLSPLIATTFIMGSHNFSENSLPFHICTTTPSSTQVMPCRRGRPIIPSHSVPTIFRAVKRTQIIRGSSNPQPLEMRDRKFPWHTCREWSHPNLPGAASWEVPPVQIKGEIGITWRRDFYRNAIYLPMCYQWIAS